MHCISSFSFSSVPCKPRSNSLPSWSMSLDGLVLLVVMIMSSSTYSVNLFVRHLALAKQGHLPALCRHPAPCVTPLHYRHTVKHLEGLDEFLFGVCPSPEDRLCRSHPHPSRYPCGGRLSRRMLRLRQNVRQIPWSCSHIRCVFAVLFSAQLVSQCKSHRHANQDYVSWTSICLNKISAQEWCDLQSLCMCSTQQGTTKNEHENTKNRRQMRETKRETRKQRDRGKK